MVILLQIAHHQICNCQARMQPPLYNFLFSNYDKKIYNYKKTHCNHAFCVIGGERKMPLLGAHMSIEGGLQKAFERIRLVEGKSLQIFSKNQRQWKVPELSPSEIDEFIKAWKQWGKGPVAIHSSYLINLANPDKNKGKQGR